MTERICGVVPAAGRGSRLGGDAPKVFIPLLSSITIWDMIRSKMSQVTDQVVLVLSPNGTEFLAANHDRLGGQNFASTVIATQNEALGMGDAIFGTSEIWRDYDSILVVWGDQFNLSPETLRACVELHATQSRPALTLPVARMAQPYVEYVFDSMERLVAVKESREGDRCSPGGFSDVGIFLLSGGDALIEEWKSYESNRTAGALTGEINFLPFLVHLSSVAKWPVARYETKDPSEAIGINTQEDLALARTILKKRIDDGGELP